MKLIPNTFGIYFADTDGNIHSKKRRRTKGGQLRKSAPNGYNVVCLCLKGKKLSRRVCRLVASAFHKNPKRLPQVNHKDGNKLNDRPENLEWCTPKQNNDHALSLGLKTHKKPILNESQVKLLSGMDFNQKQCFANKNNIHIGTIYRSISRLKELELKQ